MLLCKCVKLDFCQCWAKFQISTNVPKISDLRSQILVRMFGLSLWGTSKTSNSSRTRRLPQLPTGRDSSRAASICLQCIFAFIGFSCWSNVKPMLIVFFDYEDVVHHEYTPRSQTNNKEFTLKFSEDYATLWEWNGRIFGQATTDFFTTITRQRIDRTCATFFWQNARLQNFANLHTVMTKFSCSQDWKFGSKHRLDDRDKSNEWDDCIEGYRITNF